MPLHASMLAVTASSACCCQECMLLSALAPARKATFEHPSLPPPHPHPLAAVPYRRPDQPAALRGLQQRDVALRGAVRSALAAHRAPTPGAGRRRAADEQVGTPQLVLSTVAGAVDSGTPLLRSAVGGCMRLAPACDRGNQHSSMMLFNIRTWCHPSMHAAGM